MDGYRDLLAIAPMEGTPRPTQRFHAPLWPSGCSCLDLFSPRNRSKRSPSLTPPIHGTLASQMCRTSLINLSPQKRTDRPAPVVGAGGRAGVGRREEGVDLPDAETYLLPLAACQGEEEEAAEEGGGYQLPLACQVCLLLVGLFFLFPTCLLFIIYFFLFPILFF